MMHLPPRHSHRMFYPLLPRDLPILIYHPVRPCNFPMLLDRPANPKMHQIITHNTLRLLMRTHILTQILHRLLLIPLIPLSGIRLGHRDGAKRHT